MTSKRRFFGLPPRRLDEQGSSLALVLVMVIIVAGAGAAVLGRQTGG